MDLLYKINGGCHGLWTRRTFVAAGCAAADYYLACIVHAPLAFREKLRTFFQEQAKGMDGADVVVALKQAGEEIWAVGIDDTYSRMKHQDDEPLGNAFDITWLTVVCIKLKEIKEGKKPRVRAKG